MLGFSLCYLFKDLISPDRICQVNLHKVEKCTFLFHLPYLFYNWLLILVFPPSNEPSHTFHSFHHFQFNAKSNFSPLIKTLACCLSLFLSMFQPNSLIISFEQFSSQLNAESGALSTEQNWPELLPYSLSPSHSEISLGVYKKLLSGLHRSDSPTSQMILCREFLESPFACHSEEMQFLFKPSSFLIIFHPQINTGIAVMGIETSPSLQPAFLLFSFSFFHLPITEDRD